MNRIEQAFQTLDTQLLQEAINTGEDLTAIDSTNSPLWEDALFDYTNSWEEEVRGISWSTKKRKIKDFLSLAVKNGLNLNTFGDDGPGRKYFSFYTVVRHCCNHDLKFLQYLIDLGVNLNGIVAEGYTALEDLESDILMEECCDYTEGAKWYYDASRLLIKNGAKSYWYLHPEYNDYRHNGNNHKETKYQILATQLDCESLKEVSSDAIIRLRLDATAIEDSRYFFPHEFYAHTKTFQKRIIEYLKIVIEKIGKDSLWKGAVESCVELQYLDVMKFLLDLGIDPNINCYNASYSFVSSSALYTLKDRRYLLPKDMANQMEELLLEKGAVLTKEEKKNNYIDRPAQEKHYKFDAALHSKMIEILFRAWTTLDATDLLNYIHKDFIYDSQWVFDWMDAKQYSEYIVGKFKTIKNSNSKLDVSIVDDPTSNGQMIALSQDNNQTAFLRIECAEGRIIKMDMCMF